MHAIMIPYDTIHICMDRGVSFHFLLLLAVTVIECNNNLLCSLHR